MKVRLFAVLFILTCSMHAQVNKVALRTLNDQPVYLSLQKPYTVLIFLSPECPLCQNYTLTLTQLEEQFGRQVEFAGIVPGTFFSNREIRDFKQAYTIHFEIYRDPRKELTKRLGVTVTPEVVVVNKRGLVVYQGRIDNWAYEVGRKRKLITQHDLKNALQALLNHKQVPIAKTKAVGCFIE